MSVRAQFKGSIQKDSGMVLNLKEVDRVMKKIIKSDLVFKTHRDFIRHFWKGLHGAFSQQLKSLSLIYTYQTWTYDGKTWSYTYKVNSHFIEAGLDISRTVILETEHPLKSAWIRHFRSKRWVSSESCIQGLKILKVPIKHVQIERPEWKGWEKWNFVSS